jgi:hypothetical protein
MEGEEGLRTKEKRGRRKEDTKDNMPQHHASYDLRRSLRRRIATTVGTRDAATTSCVTTTVVINLIF